MIPLVAGGTAAKESYDKHPVWQSKRLPDFFLRDCTLSITSPTADDLYASFFFDESKSNGSDALTFIAESSTHVFRGTNTAPAEGFKNDKYYYFPAAIHLTNMGAFQEPAVTWNNPSTGITPDPNEHNYHISSVDGISFAVTGTSFGYSFRLMEESTSIVTLNALTATMYDFPFIYDDESLTLNVSGTNSIDCSDDEAAVVSFNYLKLQGNGTLTVTSKNSECSGLYSYTNYKPENNSNTTTTVLDVSTMLAADGYSVTRSARTDNPDGTYTWTYMVAPQREGGN